MYWSQWILLYEQYRTRASSTFDLVGEWHLHSTFRSSDAPVHFYFSYKKNCERVCIWVWWVLCVICTSVISRQPEFSRSTSFNTCGCLCNLAFVLSISCLFWHIQITFKWCVFAVRHVPCLMCVMLYYDELGSTVKIMHIKFLHFKFPRCAECVTPGYWTSMILSASDQPSTNT